MLDWVVGLDTEINELVEGSDLYAPSVRLENVVLPENVKEGLLAQCAAFERFRALRSDARAEASAGAAPPLARASSVGSATGSARKAARGAGALSDVLPYGAGLVVLLCGPSGTGKTMTVNALARELGKRVLMVDFPSLTGKASRGDGGEVDADLRGLFREADMSNAMLFFDECEVVFRQREHGGDRLLNALLTEIERHEGIVFLATNRPFDLDEAMHRRISTVVEFRAPDAHCRRRIWATLLPPSGPIRVAPGVDWAALSLKYELAGGFIKNAVVAALLRAIHRTRGGAAGAAADAIEAAAVRPAGAAPGAPTSPRPPARGGSDGTGGGRGPVAALPPLRLSDVVTHADLVEGCKLQMRGSLRMRSASSASCRPAGS